MTSNDSPLDETPAKRAEEPGDENEEINLEDIDRISGGATFSGPA